MAKTVVAFRRERGVTLVELMIAMGLSLLIGLAVIEVFLGQRQLYVAQDDQARMQENARFVFEQVSRDMRMVGYWGCSNKATITNNTGNSAYDTLTDDAVKAANGVLTLRFLNPDPSHRKVKSAGTIDISTLTPPLLAASCTSASLFNSTTMPAGYLDGTEVFELQTVNYQRTGANDIQRNGEVLVDKGVTGFSFVFGLATSDYVTSYVETPSAAQWSKVKSVKMSLTLTSDHAGSRTFISVIAIRNRLP